MENTVTKDDLRELRVDLTALIREGFKGVHDRQDVTNGRVTKGEIERGVHDVKLQNLEREVFHRRNGDRPARIAATPLASALTDRDLRVVIGTLTVAGAVLAFVFKLLPLLAKAF